MYTYLRKMCFHLQLENYAFVTDSSKIMQCKNVKREIILTHKLEDSKKKINLKVLENLKEHLKFSLIV